MVQQRLIVIGGTGQGKSTVINNFDCDKDAPASGANESVTRRADIYNSKKLPGLQIIDTAGFGDNKGKPDEETLSEVLQLTNESNVEIIGLLIIAPGGARVDATMVRVLNFIKDLNNDLFTRMLFFFPRSLEPEYEVEPYKDEILKLNPNAKVVVIAENLQFDRKTGNYKNFGPMVNQIQAWTKGNGFRPTYLRKTCKVCQLALDPRIYARCFSHQASDQKHGGEERFHSGGAVWYHSGAWDPNTGWRVTAGIFSLGFSELGNWGKFTCCGKSDSGCKQRYQCCNKGLSEGGCDTRCGDCKKSVGSAGCKTLCSNPSCRKSPSETGCQVGRSHQF